MPGQQQGQRFLAQLWGEEPPGLIQTWNLRDKRSEYWPHWRGIAKDGEHDVFCAMGTTVRSLGASHRARADQVCAIPGLWLDLDVKAGGASGYVDAGELAAQHIRPTIVVDSGHGIHAYYLFDNGPWVFRNTEQRDCAAALVRRFITLHRQTASFHLDSVGDLARLMRLPGTQNAKSPEHPRAVQVIHADGPRHTRRDLQHLLRDVPDQAPGAATPFDGAIGLTGDLSLFEGKLDALLQNSPEFAAVWQRERVFPSASEADLSLCSMAAGAMTDAELVRLIQTFRDDPKAQRADYLARTIRRARSTTTTTRRAA